MGTVLILNAEKKNKKSLLAREIKKINPKEEKKMAEEGVQAQNEIWPKYLG